MWQAITNCRSCGASDLTTFFSLGAMPLADAFLRREQLGRPEPSYPLDVAFCQACSLVQILATVPPEVLFAPDYPYYSSYSETFLDHARKNAESLIASRLLGPDNRVVELASNDGYLLQYFAERGIPVIGIDPAVGPARTAMEKDIPTLCEFFGKETATRLRHEGKLADVVIANNVLAHVADLNGFVEGIGIVLKDDGLAVVEVPYVKDLVDRCEFDTIYHEHHCYFSVTALDALVRRHGLHLNRVEHYPVHGGSLRLFVGKSDEPDSSVRSYLLSEENEMVTELGYYRDFASRVGAIKARLLAMLRDLKGRGKRLAAYGATAKGTVLLNYVGIDTEVIDFVVDRNPHKQGLFMPGVYIPIDDPARLLVDMPDHVLLLAWNLRDEILSQHEDYRQNGGRFLIPIPSPEIV